MLDISRRGSVIDFSHYLPPTPAIGASEVISGRRNFAHPAHLLADTSANVVQSPTFDPVINYPALSAFLLIFVIYTFLQIRITGISNAATRRMETLKSLREIKARQLSMSDVGRPSEEEIADALKRYEQALEDEERLRTVIPGVRIVAPNNPSRNKDDITAAKQFLGKDLSEASDDEPKGSRTVSGLGDTSSTKNALSDSAKAIIGIVAICQIALLFILSFDPMVASDGFSGFDGPFGLPLRYW